MSKKEEFIIVDWIGNIMFDGKTFDTFDDGWCYIYEYIEDKDDAYDDVFVELKKEK